MDQFDNISVIFTSICVAIVLIVAVLASFKIYLVKTCGVCKSGRRMDGKTVIVTGANKGLGKETALDLASRGARVILACRNLTAADAAREEIIRETLNSIVIVHQLDLSSLSSVREFARVVSESEPRLDVLVNNAGLSTLDNVVTKDKIQIEIHTNYVGPFLLTNLLLDLLKKSAPSRVIFMSSVLHHLARRDLRQLDFSAKKWTNSITQLLEYSFTKMANILNANELAERLQGTGVTVNSLHPGVVSTDVFDDLQFWLQPLVWFCSKFYWKTPRQGVQTSIYLAVSEEVGGVTGNYFQDCKEAQMSSAAQDKELGRQLWARTEEIIREAEKANGELEPENIGSLQENHSLLRQTQQQAKKSESKVDKKNI